MYSKKLVFSAATVPFMVLTQQAAAFQQRRREEKEAEAARRAKLFKQAPKDITPTNKGTFPWAGQNIDEFEKKWSMKLVKVNGVFDNSKEI